MISRIMAKLFVFIILIIVVIVTGKEFSDIRDDEINNLLKKLNKPALKTIKSPDGDIIDCVHMKNHPIYDHPLFKNHTIQMKPSSYPEGWTNESSDNKKFSMVTQLWTVNGKCPKNSIPIRRTRREDILRAKSIERYGKKDLKSIFQRKQTNPSSENVTHEHATFKAKLSNPRGKFLGAKANINVWKPQVQTPREFSLAQIWISAGTYHTQLNTIEAGWQVYQRLYGDDNPRFFIYWTVDGYKTTGCYNLNCIGFVPVNQEFAIGGVIPRVSVIGGQQESFLITIWKDGRTGNWWLKLGTNIILGYWPSSLFNRLNNFATEIEWGGEILNYKDSSQHTTTHMGSGRFAEQGYKNASFFKNLEIIDENNVVKSPRKNTRIIMSKPNCYSVTSGVDPDGDLFIYYGGPGRSRICS